MGILAGIKKVAKAIGKGAKAVVGGPAKAVTALGGGVAGVAGKTAGAVADSNARAAIAQDVLNRQRQLEDEARGNQRQIELEERNKKNLEADLAQGRARGQDLFGNEALGRVNAQRSADIADILARRKAQLEGFTPEEQQAMREQNMGAIFSNQQAGSRDLARQQARSGVRGALGAAQQAAFQQATQGQLADQERQLFLANIAEKRDALGRLEGSQRATEADELARQQFNLGQLGREKAGMLTTEFGYGGLGAQERAAALQQILGESGAASSERIAQATKGKK